MIKALRETGPDTPVLEAMQREVATVPHRAPLEGALATMQQSAGPIGVLDTSGRLVGLLTQENLGEMLMVESARANRPPPRNPWTQRA
jgi:stage IV sporulation protein FB